MSVHLLRTLWRSPLATFSTSGLVIKAVEILGGTRRSSSSSFSVRRESPRPKPQKVLNPNHLQRAHEGRRYDWCRSPPGEEVHCSRCIISDCLRRCHGTVQRSRGCPARLWFVLETVDHVTMLIRARIYMAHCLHVSLGCQACRVYCARISSLPVVGTTQRSRRRYGSGRVT